MKKLICAAALALLASVAVATPAGAASGVDLHNVNLRNATIPGSTCHKSTPITLHHGHGKGGKLRDGEKLVVDTYGKPDYGDLTHDGQDEAFLFVLCSTGGGTAGGEVRSSWVVFTGSSGKPSVLGVIYPQHQWLNSHATIMSDPAVSNGVAKVHETIWFTTDPTCCGRGSANTAWWYHNGKLRVKSTKLKITDRIVSARRVGHAALGMTVKQLKQQYGTVAHTELANGGCDVYYHGKQSKSFGALIDHSSSNKVFGIYAPIDAVTTAGVGRYASIKQIERVYAGHTIKQTTSAAGPQVLVKLAHSWLGFSMKKQYGTTGANGIRLGTRAFVTGKHTCTS